MTSTAPANAQALPSIMDERRAKIRDASLTIQRKSRSCSSFLVFRLESHAQDHIKFAGNAENARTRSRINTGFALNSGIDFPGELRKT